MFCVAGVRYDESWRSAIGDEDKLNGIKAEQDKNTEIGARTWRRKETSPNDVFYSEWLPR